MQGPVQNPQSSFGMCYGGHHQAITLVAAVCILHNFLIDVRDETEIIPDLRSEEERCVTREDGDVIDEQGEEGIGAATRDILLRHVRWIEEGED